MQSVELQVTERGTGSRSSVKSVRNQGLVPANIYGPGIDNKICAFSEKELRKAFNNDFNNNYIINLKSESGALNGKKVILKTIERDPLRWNIVHADLYELVMDRPISVSLPIHYVGTADGVKNGGGILQVIRRTLRVKALPSDIPEFIEVDISNLALSASLHIEDIKVDSKLKVLDSADFALVAVVEPEKEEVAVVATPAEGAGTAAAPGTGTGAAAAPGTGAAAAAPAAGGAAAKAPAKEAKK